MIKSETVFEVTKNDRVYRLTLVNESPLGECFDVLTEMRTEVLRIINDHSDKEKQAQPPMQQPPTEVKE